jgi:hypothetical protein
MSRRSAAPIWNVRISGGWRGRGATGLAFACLILAMAVPPRAASAPPTGSSKPHWAFQPVRDVAAHDGIDGFIAAKLREASLATSPAADKRTLIRRATFDLTGLPPTMAEVDAFIQDAAPDAYARLVERLLSSPHYGEHWARHWLDVARYSDTKGYVYAREEKMWVHATPYRDWVVRALN